MAEERHKKRTRETSRVPLNSRKRRKVGKLSLSNTRLEGFTVNKKGKGKVSRPGSGRSGLEALKKRKQGSSQKAVLEDAGVATTRGAATGRPTLLQQEGSREIIEGEGRPKKRKKSASGWAASRALLPDVAALTTQQQADWLWDSFSAATSASFLERGPLVESSLVPFPPTGPLDQRLQALEPQWRERYCQQPAAPGSATASHPPCGSPAALIVCASAVSANEVIKKLRPLSTLGWRVGKLFAKHLKVEEQRRQLEAGPVHVASGTPNRMCKLADLGALQLGGLRWLLLDVALDAKQRTILDIPETCSDWWNFYQQHLQSVLAAGQCRVVVFSSAQL